MELLLVPVPLFDKYLSAESYLLRYRFTNQSIRFSPDEKPPLLQALMESGVEAFAGGHPIFIPITTRMLPYLLNSFHQAPELSVLLLEHYSVPVGEDAIRDLQALKARGHRIAVTQHGGYIDDEALLKLADYVLFEREAMENSDRRVHVTRYKRVYREIQLLATHLADEGAFASAKEDGFHLFEGMFYRVPVTRKDRELSPIKSNLVQLLNLVRDENFEFKDIADVLQRDPALSYSLMRFINSPYLGVKYKVKSIQHAVTLLGQVEVRKWVTAAVLKALGADKPSELTRVSLMRAKFAEDLAGVFGLGEEANSLFLAGLFSALDIMLDMPMEKALNQVTVSDDIYDALVHGKGRFLPVLQFITDYERADWASVVGGCMVYAFAVPEIYRAYLNAVGWYHNLTAAHLQTAAPRGSIAPVRSL